MVARGVDIRPPALHGGMEKSANNPHKPQSDREIARLADAQHGVVASWQLELSVQALRYRVAAGRLHRKYRGVYAVGRAKLTRHGDWMAAVLAYGPEAVLSHVAAAALWEIGRNGPRIDVTTPRSKRSRAKIRHHTAVLHPEDTSRRNGIPVTSVTRTIADLAADRPEDDLLKIIEYADRAGLLNLPKLERAIQRRPHAPGVPRLNALLCDYRGAPDLRSDLERDFRKLIARAKLPEPQFNVLVAGVLADVYWPQWRLVIELDHPKYHTSPRAFENDRVRDATLQKAGIRVLRITAKRLNHQPQAVLQDIIILARTKG